MAVSVSHGPGKGKEAEQVPLVDSPSIEQEMRCLESVTVPCPLPEPLTVRRSGGCIGRTAEVAGNPAGLLLRTAVLWSLPHDGSVPSRQSEIKQPSFDI